MSYSSFLCVSVVPVKILQAGTSEHSLQRDPFLLQRDYEIEKAEGTHCSKFNIGCSKIIYKEKDSRVLLQRDYETEKAEGTRCSEFNIGCSEIIYKEKDSKYSLQREPCSMQRDSRARSIQKSISRATTVKADQTWSEKSISAEQTRTQWAEQTKPDQSRSAQQGRVVKSVAVRCSE